MGDRSGDRAGQGNNRIPYVSRKVRTQHATHGLALSCWKMCLAGFEDGAQPLNARYQKCTNLSANYHRYELEMCVSCTQWLPKPSQPGAVPLWQYRTIAGGERSPRSLQIHIR
ncbi:hypothetical protein TNCV_4734061 [Trichonephila clavipes]|nr:hypothetical protein TNCV_4734061 [Trichonephila clavipes]